LKDNQSSLHFCHYSNTPILRMFESYPVLGLHIVALGTEKIKVP
jgi:hypothetical protein